jgi:hypothetical protein
VCVCVVDNSEYVRATPGKCERLHVRGQREAMSECELMQVSE